MVERRAVSFDCWGVEDLLFVVRRGERGEGEVGGGVGEEVWGWRV